MTTNTLALGIGPGTRNTAGDWIEATFPNPVLNPDPALIDRLGIEPGASTHLAANLLADISGLGSAMPVLAAALPGFGDQSLAIVLIDTQSAPAHTLDAYLRLHLLSHRLIKPHGANMEGIFGLLPNLAWTNEGPIDPADLPSRQLAARARGEWLHVNAVDKFPRMADYVVPSGVRIGDASRIRLGAHVGEGTTVMHEGFINFNAGTLGVSMIEGRISAGVTVGNGSDLGGSSSTMGTLSGGGKTVITLGEKCLLGANAGTGIPLGDRCTIESGLYITAGTKVELKDAGNTTAEVVKARTLAGQNDLLFLRNSLTGRIECRTNKSAVELNEALHKHN
jgi:2,3,4,5-tetrahydropyridine-2-carboxylate N-succinyltransferase